MTTPHPEFVIVGGRLPDGSVAVLATDQLTYAEITTEPSFEINYRLSVGMRSWTVAYGTDYPSALAELFSRWKPPTPAAQQQLPAATPTALPSPGRNRTP